MFGDLGTFQNQRLDGGEIRDLPPAFRLDLPGRLGLLPGDGIKGKLQLLGQGIQIALDTAQLLLLAAPGKLREPDLHRRQNTSLPCSSVFVRSKRVMGPVPSSFSLKRSHRRTAAGTVRQPP